MGCIPALASRAAAPPYPPVGRKSGCFILMSYISKTMWAASGKKTKIILGNGRLMLSNVGVLQSHCTVVRARGSSSLAS